MNSGEVFGTGRTITKITHERAFAAAGHVVAAGKDVAEDGDQPPRSDERSYF